MGLEAQRDLCALFSTEIGRSHVIRFVRSNGIDVQLNAVTRMHSTTLDSQEWDKNQLIQHFGSK
jgi:hypothetical protein